jgi:hypothetical protein
VENVHGSSLLTLQNFIIPSQAVRFAAITPYIISISGTILLIVSLVYAICLIAKKDRLNISLMLFYASFYIFFTSQRFVGLPRYFAPLSFVFAIIIARFIFFAETRTSIAKILAVLFTIVLVLNTLCLAYYHVNDRYLPADELFSYIKENLPADAKFMKTMAPSPYNFYILKNGLNFNNFDPAVWADSKNQTLENLYVYMKERNITYVFFPMPAPSYDLYFYKPNTATWLDLWQIEDFKIIELVNHKIVEDMYNSKTTLFTKIAEFRRGRNIIFLAKRNI